MFFFIELSVFWMSRVIGVIAKVFLWRLVCSKPRILVERCGVPTLHLSSGGSHLYVLLW